MPLTLMRGNRMSKQEVVEDMVEKKLDDIDDSLIDKIQASLDAINDKDADEDKGTDDQQTDDDDSTPDKNQAGDDASTSDDEPDEDEDEGTDETGDTDDSKNDKATKEVQLPDAYYRAAIHQDWTPDEIKEFFEANPEKALKTLAKIHESTNKLNSTEIGYSCIFSKHFLILLQLMKKFPFSSMVQLFYSSRLLT